MIKQDKSSMKLAAAFFLLSFSTSGYSTLHKFEDESAYDDRQGVYYASKTADPQKIGFYVEVQKEYGDETITKRLPLLYKSENANSSTEYVLFNESKKTKFSETYDTAPSFQAKPLALKRCIAESEPFFSQWKYKVEHTFQLFKSDGIFTVDRTLAGAKAAQQINFRVFEAIEGAPERYSKPQGEACPASVQLGKLEEGVGSYERDSHYAHVASRLKT
ncbi:MAG: hypothetical protein ACRCYZ_00095 [Alphaproteobacteria bacterium]